MYPWLGDQSTLLMVPIPPGQKMELGSSRIRSKSFCGILRPPVKTGPFGWKSWPGLFFDYFDSGPRIWCKSVVDHVVEPRSYAAYAPSLLSELGSHHFTDKSTHDPRSRSTSVSLQLHLRCLSPLQLVMLRDAWSSLNMHMSAIWTSEPPQKKKEFPIHQLSPDFRNHPSPESQPVPLLWTCPPIQWLLESHPLEYPQQGTGTFSYRCGRCFCSPFRPFPLANQLSISRPRSTRWLMLRPVETNPLASTLNFSTTQPAVPVRTGQAALVVHPAEARVRFI